MAVRAMVRTGNYRHYKGGLYTVLCVAKHTETGEDMVVYSGLNPPAFWVRPLSNFTEIVEVAGTKVPRFERIGGQTTNPAGNQC